MLFQALYFETAIAKHPRVQALKKRYSDIPHIPCDRYGEVFNRKAQNFRIQKQQPSLILAEKHGSLVLPTPEGYGIGTKYNFYFSHMLNCLYDCRYCFLQGMYDSAHYVLFVNFEDFQSEIEKVIALYPSERVTFFTGYDCDSFALDAVTGFLDAFLPFFKNHPEAFFELRTKSCSIQALKKIEPLQNVIIAYTLSPELIVKKVEHRTPSLKRRLKTLQELQREGWHIGLRFDPLLFVDHWKEIYSSFFEEVFHEISPHVIHSVTMGALRYPQPIYKRAARLYPDEPLFAHALAPRESLVSYPVDIERSLVSHCRDCVLQYLSPNTLFQVEIPS